MNKIAEQARLKASLEKLARFGSPVDSTVADLRIDNEKVEIEQVGGIFESQIFQLQNRRVAYIADIAVTNQTSRSIDVIDVKLQTPWDNRLFEWVTPFQVKVTPLQVKLQGRAKRDNPFVYEFPGERALRFAYDEVINHHLLEARRLPAKHRLRGLLLGIGDFMPDNLVHGELLEMSLIIIGADHAEYFEPIRFWTERLLPRPTAVKTRTSIFAELVEEEAARARDVTGTAPLPASPPLRPIELKSVGTLLRIFDQLGRLLVRIKLCNAGQTDWDGVGLRREFSILPRIDGS